MDNVTFITEQKDWFEAALAKKQLAFYELQKKKLPQLDFEDAIAKNKFLISSFKSKAA